MAARFFIALSLLSLAAGDAVTATDEAGQKKLIRSRRDKRKDSESVAVRVSASDYEIQMHNERDTQATETQGIAASSDLKFEPYLGTPVKGLEATDPNKPAMRNERKQQDTQDAAASLDLESENSGKATEPKKTAMRNERKEQDTQSAAASLDLKSANLGKATEPKKLVRKQRETASVAMSADGQIAEHKGRDTQLSDTQTGAISSDGTFEAVGVEDPSLLDPSVHYMSEESLLDKSGDSANPCSYLGCNSRKCAWVSGGVINRVVAGRGCSNAVTVGLGEDLLKSQEKVSFVTNAAKILSLRDCQRAVRDQSSICSGYFQLHRDTLTCSCVPSGGSCDEEHDAGVCRYQVVEH